MQRKVVRRFKTYKRRLIGWKESSRWKLSPANEVSFTTSWPLKSLPSILASRLSTDNLTYRSWKLRRTRSQWDIDCLTCWARAMTKQVKCSDVSPKTIPTAWALHQPQSDWSTTRSRVEVTCSQTWMVMKNQSKCIRWCCRVSPWAQLVTGKTCKTLICRSHVSILQLRAMISLA